MSIKTKPTEIAQATIEQVWQLLYHPENYSLWWDAETIGINPAGHVHAGQTISIQTTEFGKQWKVDKIPKQISVEVKIPFGVVVREVISCIAVEQSCRITYDAEIILPPGLKGKIMKLLFSKSFTNSIRDSLQRLKAAAEKMNISN